MNVGQLIANLSRLNPKLPVVASGYEGGETLVTNARETELTYEPDNGWWDGEYEEVEKWKTSNNKPFKAVKIVGRRH